MHPTTVPKHVVRPCAAVKRVGIRFCFSCDEQASLWVSPVLPVAEYMVGRRMDDQLLLSFTFHHKPLDQEGNALAESDTPDGHGFSLQTGKSLPIPSLLRNPNKRFKNEKRVSALWLNISSSDSVYAGLDVGFGERRPPVAGGGLSCQNGASCFVAAGRQPQSSDPLQCWAYQNNLFCTDTSHRHEGTTYSALRGAVSHL